MLLIEVLLLFVSVLGDKLKSSRKEICQKHPTMRIVTQGGARYTCYWSVFGTIKQLQTAKQGINSPAVQLQTRLTEASTNTSPSSTALSASPPRRAAAAVGQGDTPVLLKL